MRGSGWASGALLMVAGVWVLCQILGGDALGRLGITGQTTTPGQSSSAGSTAPPGVTPTPSPGGSTPAPGGTPTPQPTPGGG